MFITFNSPDVCLTPTPTPDGAETAAKETSPNLKVTAQTAIPFQDQMVCCELVWGRGYSSLEAPQYWAEEEPETQDVAQANHKDLRGGSGVRRGDWSGADRTLWPKPPEGELSHLCCHTSLFSGLHSSELRESAL